jgi:hypothetical protein
MMVALRSMRIKLVGVNLVVLQLIENLLAFSGKYNANKSQVLHASKHL